MKFCTKCGASTEGRHNFCGHCGNPVATSQWWLDEPVTRANAANPTATKKPVKPFQKFAKSFFIASMSIFAVVMLFVWLIPAPDTTTPRAIEDAPEATVTPPGGADYVIVVEFSGCRDREAKDKLTQYAVDKDDAAFNSAWEEYASTGECVILKVGTAVFVVDSAIFSGLVKNENHRRIFAGRRSIHGISSFG
jgi:hypothetical protein